jgi:hypothetical protein
MSVPIQTHSREELPGGDNFESRRGNEASQAFPLSGKSGVNVEASSAPYQGKARNDLNNGACVSGRELERAKPADFRSIEGSYSGDHRGPHSDTAKASLNKAADNGGPRVPSGQFPSGRRDATLGSFSKDHSDQSYPTPDNGD